MLFTRVTFVAFMNYVNVFRQIAFMKNGFYFLNLPTVNESTAHLKKTMYYIFAILLNNNHTTIRGEKPPVKSEYVTTKYAKKVGDFEECKSSKSPTFRYT